MIWLRRICCPAIISGFLTPIVIGLWAGSSTSDLSQEPLTDWIISGVSFSVAMSVAYLCIAVPSAKLLKSQNAMATSLLLVVIAALAGFGIPWILLLGPLLDGGDPRAVAILSVMGGALGLLGALAWLPFSSDLLSRSG